MINKIWPILMSTFGCKQSGEDCIYGKCKSHYFTCELLSTRLCEVLAEEQEQVLAEGKKLRIKIRRKAIELYQKKLKEKQGQLHNGHFTDEILEETLGELK